MSKEEIQRVYKYFELSETLITLEKEIKNIITRSSGINMDYGCWLVGVVELEKQYDEHREKYYLYDDSERAYQQDNYFLWQKTQYEDDYYGCIYYPLEDKKYLKIDYSC